MSNALNRDDAPLVGLPPLRPARFVSRHKRFIVHARSEGSGSPEELRCHLADPGRLVGILEPGVRIWLSGPYPAPRKLPWSVHLAEVQTDDGPVLVTLDSTLANTAAVEAHARGFVPVLPPESPRRELTVTLHSSGHARIASGADTAEATRHRFDLGWPHAEERRLFLTEIKTVSHNEAGFGLWPDAPSARGRSHLEALIQHKKAGGDSALMFVTGRHDIRQIRPFRTIDPEFSQLLGEADECGVHLLGMRLRLETDGAYWAGQCEVSPLPLSRETG